MRNKTYKSPTDQCLSTLELAQEWVRQIDPFIRMLPTSLETNYDKTAWDKAAEAVNQQKSVRFKKSILNQLEHFWGGQEFKWGIWEIGRACKNTKHLISGDIVLILMNNGTDRLPIFCASTKGKNIVGYYFETNRLGFDSDIEILGRPGKLTGKELTHPDARAYMLKLRVD